MLQRAIKIRTQFEGIHCWPEAPDEVCFLRKRHRHMFQIEAEVEVSHNDRDIEFIILKRRVDEWLKTKYNNEANGNVWHMGRMSCEQVAEQVIEVIKQYAGHGRTITVTVSEDGENAATVCYIDEDWQLANDFERQMLDVAKVMALAGMELSEEPMYMSDYQQESYVAIQEHENNKEEVMHWAIGLGEEAGEALSVIKHKYYGGKYDIEDLVNELGDTLWHIAALCTACNIKLEDVAAYNLAKLNHRYPAGSFDNERSIKRHDVHKSFKDTEERRKLLEKILGNQ